MEENLQLTADQPNTEGGKPERKPLNKPLIIASSVGLILILGMAVFIGVLNSKVNTLTMRYEQSMKNVDQQFNSVNALKQDVQSTKEVTKTLTKLTWLAKLSHEIEDGVVTDDFVAKKVFLNENNGKLNVVIDLETQPDMYIHYKGKGSFDLTDRDLRSKATAIIDKVKEYYNKNTFEALPKWDDNTNVNLTIKNYDIGKFIGGQFVLAGEK
jgi:phosphoglycerol transferase MdoB-like AlkP superfamily enzyme